MEPIRVSENEVNRASLIHLLSNFADDERYADEKELLNDLVKWVERVRFAEE